MLIPVILSGGSGTRLWPLSREFYPKQLLPLVNNKTMLQNTLTRLDGISGLADPVVVCNEAHRFMVAEQLRQVGCSASAIILEPVGRNTAPAVAVAALQALSQDEDALLLVLPADHVIQNHEKLREAIESGIFCAQDDKLIAFGVVPTGPETGYGYIKAGVRLKAEGGPTPDIFSVDRFVEKPDLKTAQEYVDSGDYFWNSGMFLFKASCYLRQLEQFAPEIFSACRKAFDGLEKDLDFSRLDVDTFSACPSDSIDYAVMEKTSDSVVIPLDAGWSDAGSWSALWEIGGKDANGNVAVGDVLTTADVRDCYLHAESRMLAAIGVENHVVIETADAVLVAPKDKVQDVKLIVEKLKKQKRDEALLHRRVNRPWGSYEGIDAAERFQVKRIAVAEKASR